MDIGDFFSFDKFIAPSIVKPLYWILMIVIVAVGVWTFVYDGLFFWLRSSVDWDQGIGNMIGSVVWVAVMLPILRVATETVLVQFEIRDKLKGGEPPQQLS
jgi:uncharacterized membrane protein YvlD (DUF360 family)